MASAYLKYKFNNLPKQLVVQNFQVVGNYVYALQIFNETKNAVISQGVINGTDVDFFNGKNSIYLYDFGHTQTLEYFHHGNKDYFWVGTKYDPQTTDTKWSTQLARIPFNPNNFTGTFNGNTSVQRFSSLTSPQGKQLGKMYRSDASLSSDKKILMIAIQNKQKEVTFVMYDHDKLNDELDKLSGNGYKPIKNVKQNKFIFGSQISTDLTSISMQGYAVTNKQSVYMSSGKAGKAKYIYKYPQNEKVRVSNKYWTGNNAEIEAVRIDGKSDLIFGLSYHQLVNNKWITTENRIYRVAKSNW